MTVKANYSIKVQGILDESWKETFDVLTMEFDDEDNTLLTGDLDQATLHGILKKIRDLGIIILHVKSLDNSG